MAGVCECHSQQRHSVPPFISYSLLFVQQRHKALGCFSCLVGRKWTSFSSSVVNQMHTIRDHTGPSVFNFFRESELLLKNMSAISASKVTIRHISCPPVTHESKWRFETTAFVFSIEVFPSDINLENTKLPLN